MHKQEHKTNLPETMGWDAINGIRFALGSLIQSQIFTFMLKCAFIVLIIFARGESP